MNTNVLYLLQHIALLCNQDFIICKTDNTDLSYLKAYEYIHPNQQAMIVLPAVYSMLS